MGINMSDMFGSVVDLFSVNDTVTLKRITQVIDKYGDDTPTYSSEEDILVAVNDITGEEQWNKNGLFVPGDKLFFIKSTVDIPSNGDVITYRLNDYKIVRVNSPDMGEITHYECYCKRTN